MDQLGIATQMKAKTRLSGPGRAVSTTVVNDEAEFGFIMINEIVVDDRVELVGPLPAPIQYYTQFSVGVVASGKQQEGGAALAKMMSSPGTFEVMRKLGFEAF